MDLTVLSQALAAAGVISSVERDPFFNQTALLLHGDGTNGAQNNTFLDGSTNNFTITRNGNTTQGTFSPFSLPNGEWGVYFPGSSRLSVPGGSDFDQDGNFTIEFWFYPANASGNVELWYALKNGSCAVTYNTSKKFLIDVPFVGIQVTSTNTFEPNSWYHVAAVRNGATTTLYVNGVSEGTTNYNFVANGGTAIDYICQNVVGYVSNMRFVKSAVYTSAFTPPTAPLTAIANTSVLMLQSNRFVDNNASPKTITIAAGSPSIQPFSPFQPSSAYSTSVNGGSGYFDGTGDWLNIADNAVFRPQTAFTVEAWVYPTTTGTRFVAAQAKDNAAASSSWGLYLDTTTATFFFYEGSTQHFVESAIGAPVNAWTHVAGVWNGTQMRLFINGTQSGSTTSYSGTPNDASIAVKIGAREASSGTGGADYFTGYISDLRIVKGTAVYTGTFTPPTAPLTAITNTSLLTNFTNAGIFDNTGKNNLETVGNAQIDTSVKKYGTGSLEFDGNGDYLFVPSNNNFVFEGDFTIEFWLYRAGSSVGGTGNYEALVATYNGSNGYGIWWLNTTNVLHTRVEATTVDTTTGLSNSTWYHIAVTRSGSTVRTFVDGVVGSTLTSSSTATNPGLYIGSQTINKNFNGFIDDLRITKGIARYTANFTPPTAALPDL